MPVNRQSLGWLFVILLAGIRCAEYESWPRHWQAAAATEPLTGADCGVTEAVVQRVIDGDTLELADGRVVRLRYLDAPEASAEDAECFGQLAYEELRSLATGATVRLGFGARCQDDFDRWLAVLEVPRAGDVGLVLVERGAACLLPRSDDTMPTAYVTAADKAQNAAVGLWGYCQRLPC